MESADQAVKSRVIKIGNSQGIRIPKLLMEQCGLQSEVALEVGEGCLVVRPVTKVRSGWDAAFAAMAENRDDVLLDEAAVTDWDSTEWEW